MNIIEELKQRESFFQASSSDLEAYLQSGSRTFYLGIDPTADSLHIGHFATLNVAMHLMNAGHKFILVVGGATGMIGDPSGKSEERNLLDEATLAKNVAGIKNWCENFFGDNNNWQIVNNYDWTSKLDLISFLRDTGKHFSINTMLKRDSVANRLGEESFFSYTEFSYSLLQAYDFLYLFENYGCTMQIGASDQWGNMLAGTELIHKKLGADAYVLTAPLVVDSKTGKKFGKSEKGTIWLDKNKTNSYELYQFFLNIPDEDIKTLTRRLIVRSIDEVNQMLEIIDPIEAKKTLAYAIVFGVHGENDANIARDLSEKLFAGDVANLNADEFEMLSSVLPKTNQTDIVEALIETSLASSKREAREFIENGAVSVAGEKITDTSYQIPQTPALIKKGKKDYAIIIN
ncbi:MAG: tyrosine--tRNA ligase [Candidatus Pacebacteria bacterium]|nr:tyrosine--tRNA ligase [Candidatus Paceibacterota bacterium]